MPFRDLLSSVDATKWQNIEPHYAALATRPLRCGGCLERLILDRSDLDARVAEAEADLFIAMTCHTDDAEKQAAYAAFVSDVGPRVQEAGFALDRRIVQSEFVGQLPRPRYEVLLRDRGVDVELFRPESVPLQTELTILDQEYSQIAGRQTVMHDGTERTIAQMMGLLEGTDRALRERAWKGIFGRRFADRAAIDTLYDTILDRRLAIARNAGFRDFRDYQHRRLRRFDYTPADCADFHAAVERHAVPLMRRFDGERAAALGLGGAGGPGGGPLRPWDLAVDIEGRAPLRPFRDADELVERAARIFHRLDPRLAALFDELRAGGRLDLESRKGKAPGGYQYDRPWSRTPFIFMNAAGLQRDVVTMVHEAGHAFHSGLCRDEPIMHYRTSPVEFSEVASMAMELVTLPFLGEFYSDADAERARVDLLRDIPGKLAWIAQIDAFQHWVHTHPGHSTAQREEAWLELDERFGHAISWEGLEPWRGVAWQRQLHLFGSPFYYIEYGIAQLGAISIWRRFRDEPAAALDAYVQALALGGSRPLPDLFAAAGLRFGMGDDVVGEAMREIAGALAARTD